MILLNCVKSWLKLLKFYVKIKLSFLEGVFLWKIVTINLKKTV